MAAASYRVRVAAHPGLSARRSLYCGTSRSHPVSDRRIIALAHLRRRTLARPAEPREHARDAVAMGMHSRQPPNHRRDPRQGAEVGRRPRAPW